MIRKYILTLLSLGALTASAALSVKAPKVEALTNPVGLETPAPRLSWQLASDARDVAQTAYRILVASTPELLAQGRGDLWDSGMVESDQSLYVPYNGKPLGSRQRAYWKVMATDNHGQAAWSEPASWTMALTEPGDWTAQWIGLQYDPADNWQSRTRIPARYMRKDFKLQDKPIERATMYISGLGLYEPFVNGQRIGDQELAPTVTNYRKDVKYNILDVTDAVKAGDNAVGISLGSGRYSTIRSGESNDYFATVDIPALVHYGTPQLLMQIEVEYADGTTDRIVSDKSWRGTANGPIRSANEYDGEIYDANMELADWTLPGYDDSKWRRAVNAEVPTGALHAQLNPNIKVMQRLKPLSVTPTSRGTYIVDMGQNMVGWMQLTADMAKGDTVRIRFAEILKPGTDSLFTDNLRGAEAATTYIAGRDGKATWHPVFTYYGFRYAEIDGLRNAPAVDDIVGEVLYDEMADLSRFNTSDPTINAIHKNAYWGIRGNYRSVPTDCPQRDERQGWLGDRASGCYGESYMMDNHALYAKWLDDIFNEQGPAGDIPDVAPASWVIRSDNMTWCGTPIPVADMLLQRFGDTQPIVKHYDGMKLFMNYMKARYGRDGLITKDTYGDWCMPPERQDLIHSQDPTRITDGAVISTAYYYDLAKRLKKFATIAGQPADTSYWEAEAQKAKKAFNDNFFNADKGSYSNNTITANLLPLRYGMVPEGQEQRVFQNIVDKTEKDWGGHVSCGVIGVQQLMRGLSDYGRDDLALKLTTSRDYPSWGYMVDHGATTIWELWNGDTADPGMNSGNHVMLLGDLITWYYEYLAGIANAPGSNAYKVIEMRPHFIQGLNNVEATYDSPRGPITSAWRRKGNAINWDIDIPANATAQVNIPLVKGRLASKTRRALEQMGASYLRDADGHAVFTFPSGSYALHFNI